MRGLLAIAGLALAACQPAPAAKPVRVPVEVGSLPEGYAEMLPAGYGPADVYWLRNDPRGPGCYYYDVNGEDRLLACVG